MKTQSQKRFPRLSSIIGIIICIFLAPILIMNLTIIVKSYINPDKVPDFFGIKPFIVLTGSMEPEIHGGDLAIIKTVDPSQLKADDIISYKYGSAVITHRIIGLTEKDKAPAFITKGDANNSEDSNAVIYSQVEGIYFLKIAKAGNLAMFMQTPVGMLVFVGIPLCCFIIYEIIRRRFYEKQEKAKFNQAQAEIEMLKTQLVEKNAE